MWVLANHIMNVEVRGQLRESSLCPLCGSWAIKLSNQLSGKCPDVLSCLCRPVFEQLIQWRSKKKHSAHRVVEVLVFMSAGLVQTNISSFYVFAKIFFT